MGDPATYPTKEEVELDKKRDPLTVMRAHLAKAGVKDKDLDAIDAEVEAMVMESIQCADQSAEPAPEDLYTDVHAP